MDSAPGKGEHDTNTGQESDTPSSYAEDDETNSNRVKEKDSGRSITALEVPAQPDSSPITIESEKEPGIGCPGGDTIIVDNGDGDGIGQSVVKSSSKSQDKISTNIPPDEDMGEEITMKPQPDSDTTPKKGVDKLDKDVSVTDNGDGVTVENPEESSGKSQISYMTVNVPDEDSDSEEDFTMESESDIGATARETAASTDEENGNRCNLDERVGIPRLATDKTMDIGSENKGIFIEPTTKASDKGVDNNDEKDKNPSTLGNPSLDEGEEKQQRVGETTGEDETAEGDTADRPCVQGSPATEPTNKDEKKTTEVGDGPDVVTISDDEDGHETIREDNESEKTESGDEEMGSSGEKVISCNPDTPIPMEDDDDDLMIIEELPAPMRMQPDLEMDCQDEPMENAQRTKQLDHAKSFKETMRLVKNWSLRNRTKSNRPNILGHRSAVGPIRAPLTRPFQPVRPGLNQPPRQINISRGFISARPVTTAVGLQQLNLNNNRPQTRLLKQPAQARPYLRPPPLQLSTALTRGSRPAMPQAVSVVRPPVPVAANQRNDPMGTVPQQITLPNGQVVTMKNFQPLLFDTTSGLLLLPQSVTGGSGTVNPTSAASQIRAAVAGVMASNRYPAPAGTQPRPRMTTRPSAVTPPAFAPKIISTSSLQPKVVRPNKVPPRPQRPILRPGPNPALRQKIPTPTVPIPPPLVNKTTSQVAKPRTPTPMVRPPAPVPQVPQMETANPISGTQADSVNSDPKDPNNNKTFPSLVVVVKPCLGDKVTRQALNAARTDLDGRVKALLLHSPAKLTEWLMQQGLLRLEHRCVIHMNSDRENIKYKLGMYSDGAKQPFSGGYVWITECCPDKQVSVFHGSIFESAVYTPGTVMKLIYHWACQTTAQNVLQWVKVSSYYLKNFYTLLRSCCVAGLHEYAPMMGGLDKFVEVGIITLGSSVNQVSPNQRPVKIEIVGIFDSAAKVVRMKVINPLSNTSGTSAATTAQTRVQQILWPLKSWVNKDSTILIDNSIDKNALIEMGFKNVIQTKIGMATGGASQPTNANVMNYLKHVVPKMFQNTLCVLSKSLIQQFLDELSWRELWGSTSAASFDNLIQHLVQMTKWEMSETLISRLNRISLNPFGEWAYSKAFLAPTGIDMLPDSIRGAGSDMPTLEAYAAYIDAANGYSTSSPPSSPNPNKKRKRKEPTGNGTMNPPLLFPEISQGKKLLKRKGDLMDKDDMKLYLMEKSRDLANCINLYDYYYAESRTVIDRAVIAAFPIHLKCPLCYRGFLTNQEIVRHIASHVNSVGRASTQVVFCEFCLKEIPNLSAYSAHVSEVHRQEFTAFPCYICQDSFPHKTGLTLHMWQTHGKAEMPYRCECCKYRNSRHHEVVEHFAREHCGSDQVLCPICLKVFSTRNLGDIQSIVIHLQNHSGKKGKRCTQCVLTFAADMDLRSHYASGLHEVPSASVAYSSLPSVEDKDLLMPRPPTGARSLLPLPPSKKSKTAHHVYSAKEVNKTKAKDPHVAQLDKEGALRIENIKFYSYKGEDPNEVYRCCECKNDILTPQHFTGCFACSKCKFNTSCEMSMLTHNRNVHPLGRTAKGIASMHTKPVSHPGVKCRCGASPKTLKQLVAHLANCKKGTGTFETKSFEEEDMDEAGSGKSPGSVNSESGSNSEETRPGETEKGILMNLGLRPSREMRV